MTEHPEPSEEEEELTDTDRHHDEEAMRAPDHENPRREGEEDDEA